ncbi:MAG: hypothetical protein ABR508_05395 [Candidatus Baltobacteraceae bacterium]
MTWSRTLRIDAEAEEARQRIEVLAGYEGVRARSGPAGEYGRTYVLVQAPGSVDPAELALRFQARWFDEAILALAIEPQPPDALPQLRTALAGAGGLAGILSARITGAALIVECAPRTAPELLRSLIDAELRRFGGTHKTRMLAPLPDDVLAAIAGRGLQAPEIAASRILESLLEAAHVE